jgi:hypothetical protein
MLLLPSLVLAHARLVSPPPRTTSIGKTPPCAGVPRTSTPTVLTAGEQVEVDWVETVDHPGHYELAISTADDQDFVTLLGDIPDGAFAANATHRDYGTWLQVPPTPCDACTLQLIQFMSDHPPGSQYYYSCADIRIVAAATTTTTTIDGSAPPTTSTTTPSGCDGLPPRERATCLLAQAASAPVCGAEPLDVRLESALDAGLAKVRRLLDEAVAPGTAAKRMRHLLGAAGRRLAKLRRKLDAATHRGRVTASCARSIASLLDDLEAAVAGIVP